MRKILLLTTLAILAGVASGQTSYSYRYWIDSDLGSVVSGSGTGETQFDADLSEVGSGLHALHVQARYPSGVWSSTHTRYFIIDKQLVATAACYWLDNDMNTLQNNVATSGVIELDISALKAGLHTVHYQTLSASGIPSSTHTRYFIIDEQFVATTARYWLDNDMKTLQNNVATSGVIELEISGLKAGLHTVHYQTLSASGIPSSTHTRYFIINEQLAATTARYWLDSDMKTLHNNVATSGVIDLDLSTLSAGLHAVHYQTVAANGIPSAVRTHYFYYAGQPNNYTARIWIDDNEASAKSYAVDNEIIEIDLGELEGEHLLHVVIYDGQENIVDEQTQTFTIESGIEEFSLFATVTATTQGNTDISTTMDTENLWTNNLKYKLSIDPNSNPKVVNAYGEISDATLNYFQFNWDYTTVGNYSGTDAYFEAGYLKEGFRTLTITPTNIENLIDGELYVFKLTAYEIVDDVEVPRQVTTISLVKLMPEIATRLVFRPGQETTDGSGDVIAYMNPNKQGTSANSYAPFDDYNFVSYQTIADLEKCYDARDAKASNGFKNLTNIFYNLSMNGQNGYNNNPDVYNEDEWDKTFEFVFANSDATGTKDLVDYSGKGIAFKHPQGNQTSEKYMLQVPASLIDGTTKHTVKVYTVYAGVSTKLKSDGTLDCFNKDYHVSNGQNIAFTYACWHHANTFAWSSDDKKPNLQWSSETTTKTSSFTDILSKNFYDPGFFGNGTTSGRNLSDLANKNFLVSINNCELNTKADGSGKKNKYFCPSISGSTITYTQQSGSAPTSDHTEYLIITAKDAFDHDVKIVLEVLITSLPQQTIHVETAGTLSNYISDSEKYTMTELTLTGYLNSTDFKLLRDMAGNNYLGEETAGKLQKLDLSGAIIVKGGENYLEAEYVYYKSGYGISTSGNALAVENDNELGKDVFMGCKLQEVILPSSLTSIAEFAFCYCLQLTNVTLPEDLLSIGDAVFLECEALSTLTIPNSVMTLGRYAFAYCNSLTNMAIPDGITTLEDNLFYDCRGLSSVTIPASVTSLKNQVFELCSSLTEVTVYRSEPPSTGNYHTFTTQANATLYVPYGCKAAYEVADYWKDFKEIVEIQPEQTDKETLSVKDINAKSSSTVEMAIDLTNESEDLTAYQFDLILPGGISLSVNDKGKYQVSKTGRYEDDSQTLNVSKVEGSTNTYRIVCFSMSNEVITGTSGAILDAVLATDANIVDGTYEGKITNIVFTKTDGSQEKLNDAKFNIVISNFIPGDANGDGEVNVTDIVEIVNYIMEKPSDRFVAAAADLNDDGEINVTDIVKVVSIIMSAGVNAPQRVSALEMVDNDQLTLAVNDRVYSLHLNNEAQYVASQFEIRLGEGQTLEGVRLNGNRSDGHQVTYAKTGSNLYKVVVFSAENRPFNGNNGELLSFKVSGNGSIEVSNILFVTYGETEKLFPSLSAGTTGIDVTKTSDAMDVYSIDGRMVRRQVTSTNGLGKGMYIINGKKTIVK